MQYNIYSKYIQKQITPCCSPWYISCMVHQVSSKHSRIHDQFFSKILPLISYESLSKRKAPRYTRRKLVIFQTQAGPTFFLKLAVGLVFGHRLFGSPVVAPGPGVLAGDQGAGAAVLQMVVQAASLQLLSARVGVGTRHHLFVEKPAKNKTVLLMPIKTWNCSYMS